MRRASQVLWEASRQLAAGLCLLAVSLTWATGASQAVGTDLDVVLDSTQHWVGMNDVLLSVFDADGGSLAERAQPLLIELIGPSGQRVAVEPAIEQFATYGRSLYRARVALDEVGAWEVSASADVAGTALTGMTVLEVSADEGTPALGSAVPGGDTPTMFDAHSLMHHISSDPEPVTAFYTWSLDDALAQHQPTVFILDSYAARPNAACGGALAILHDIFFDYPGLTVVHAEPWETAPGDDGKLQLDPPGGPPVLTDYATAWGVTDPPWIFVIDREGRLQAKFTGVVGSDELRAAMASVATWRPAA
ncbi:MAG TPA: hypothetical protein VFF55_02945 [Candidatus Deferrimicrobium sp.]|nr:hypothetical protein [Candidatus Deferrimicrobium sp.]